MKYTFDIETDSINPDDVTKVYCLAIKENDKKTFVLTNIEAGVLILEQADYLVGHNIITFDIPILKRLYNLKLKKECVILDTFLLAQVLAFDQRENDHKLIHFKKLDSKLLNSHSLKAWGQRLGALKIDLDVSNITMCTQKLLDYCKQDVDVSFVLLQYLLRLGIQHKVIKLENNITAIIDEHSKYGFHFDLEKALILKKKLEDTIIELKLILQNKFGTVSDKKNKPVLFNPNSRDHISHKLKEFYNWQATEFTETGKPQITEKVLEKLDYPFVIEIKKYMMLQKRLSQLALGSSALLNNIKNGYIKSKIFTHGTVSGRASHVKPNISQVPATYTEYGTEFRALFTVPDDRYVLLGADASGLELRVLAHYLNDKEYTRQILDGDIHTHNQKLVGLADRDTAKTFIYAFIYGGGDAILASIANVKNGKKLRETFLKNLPALEKLKDKITKNTYFVGLDGRMFRYRSKHSALNLLLQSAGAIICKQWIINIIKNTQNWETGYNKDFFISTWVHDEVQITVKKELAEQLAEVVIKSLEEVTQNLKLKCPLAGEYKIGNNWSETH